MSIFDERKSGDAFGGARRRMLRWLVFFGLLLWLLPAQWMHWATAQAQMDIKLLLKPTVAVRGSDLLIPLGRNPGQMRWPRTLRATVGDKEVEAFIVWMQPDFSAVKNWVTPAEPIKVNSQAYGLRKLSDGRPVAIVPIPKEATGSIEFLGERWAMNYLPLPDALDGPELTISNPNVSPSKTDPFEYFRWVLMAESMNSSPPSPEGNEVTQRIARAVANEWRAGLVRIGRESPGVAAELRERLTATVNDERRMDPGDQIAAWLTGARQLTTLRSLMIDVARTDEEAMRASLSWLDSQPDFHAWFEATAGDRTRLCVINPTLDEIVISASWQGSDDVPVGLVIPSKSLVRHEVARPTLAANAVVPSNEQLVLSSEAQAPVRLDAGPRSIPVRPPGIQFQPMLLPLTLAEICGNFRDAPASAQSTSAMLRRRFGRWEIFVECFHIRPNEDDRILLQIGSPTDPVAVLEIDAAGSWRVMPGKAESGLDIKVQSFIDRWRCQVVLPEAWLIEAITSDSGGAVLLGLRRDGPGDIRQFAVIASPTFEADIAGVAFDLAAWGEARNVYP